MSSIDSSGCCSCSVHLWKKSILKHLPHPLVIHLDEFHTYCHLPRIIADVLGHNSSSLYSFWNYQAYDHDPETVERVFDTRRALEELLEHFEELHHGAPKPYH
jgi:hypothetical protein